MSKILISSFFSLTPNQKEKFIELFLSFRELGHECVFWSFNQIDDLKEYQIIIDFDHPEYLTWFEEISQNPSFIGFDHSKWITRIQNRLSIDPDRYLYHDHLINKFATEHSSLGDASIPLVGYKAIFSYSYLLLELLKPDLFLAWNPHHYMSGIAYDIAHSLNIKVGAIENGYLPNTILVDSKGIAASSLLQSFSLDQLMNDKQGYYHEIGTSIFRNYKDSNYSLYRQNSLSSSLPESNKLESPKIVCFGTPEVDAGCIPIETSESLINLPFHNNSYELALDVAKVNLGCTIFKPHPHSNCSGMGVPEIGFYVTDADPIDLIQWADVIVCTASKLEFTSLFLGKPVVLFGSGLLWNKGCTYEIHNPEELIDVLNIAFKNSDFTSKFDAYVKYLGYLVCHYLYNLNTSCPLNHFRDSVQFVTDFEEMFLLPRSSQKSSDHISNIFAVNLLNHWPNSSLKVQPPQEISLRSLMRSRFKHLLVKLKQLA